MKARLLLLVLLSSFSAAAQAAQFTFDFSKGLQGCVGGFADYPVDPAQHDIYKLDWTLAPAPNLPAQNALKIMGTNRSDDLFMFAKCYVDAGLVPHSQHKISFEVTASVDAPAGCFGAGGSPDALTLKAGASAVEPRAVADGKGEFAMYLLNLDKGNQTNGGSDLAVLSTSMNNGIPCEDPEADQFKTIVKNSLSESRFTADARGGFWIVWGTDSGYESESTIYYQKISAKIR